MRFEVKIAVPLLLVGALLGCSNQGSTSLLWSQAQIDNVTNICVNRASAGDPTLAVQAKQVCTCVYRKAAQKWTYDYYQSNLTTCEQWLEQVAEPDCLEGK